MISVEHEEELKRLTLNAFNGLITITDLVNGATEINMIVSCYSSNPLSVIYIRNLTENSFVQAVALPSYGDIKIVTTHHEVEPWLK